MLRFGGDGACCSVARDRILLGCGIFERFAGFFGEPVFVPRIRHSSSSELSTIGSVSSFLTGPERRISGSSSSSGPLDRFLFFLTPSDLGLSHPPRLACLLGPIPRSKISAALPTSSLERSRASSSCLLGYFAGRSSSASSSVLFMA